MCYRPSAAEGTKCPKCGATNTAGKTERVYCGASLITADDEEINNITKPTAPAVPAPIRAPAIPVAPPAPPTQ